MLLLWMSCVPHVQCPWVPRKALLNNICYCYHTVDWLFRIRGHPSCAGWTASFQRVYISSISTIGVDWAPGSSTERVNHCKSSPVPYICHGVLKCERVSTIPFDRSGHVRRLSLLLPSCFLVCFFPVLILVPSFRKRFLLLIRSSIKPVPKRVYNKTEDQRFIYIFFGGGE